MNLFRNWASKALLIFCIVIFAFTGAWAEESEMPPEATEEIMETVPEEEQPEETPEVPTEDVPVACPQDLFQMELKVPQNWRNDAVVNVRLKSLPKRIHCGARLRSGWAKRPGVISKTTHSFSTAIISRILKSTIIPK